MRRILMALAETAYRYAKDGAGMPSYRGVYEPEVPDELKNMPDEENEN
ncbi:MAG: cyclic lactone autoinducer peptide [Clostridia bacterium]|nr:cyclic lactone autoinducer peptide [Clostridia bacterium]